MAPQAPVITAFKENRGPYAISVMRGKLLYIKHYAGLITHKKRPQYLSISGPAKRIVKHEREAVILKI